MLILEKGEKYLVQNTDRNKYIIVENLGPDTCYARSTKAEEGFAGYKITRYSDHEFCVAADEQIEITSLGKVTVRITGTNF